MDGSTEEDEVDDDEDVDRDEWDCAGQANAYKSARTCKELSQTTERTTRTPHQRPDSIYQLNRPHLDARFSPSSTHIPLWHPVAVESSPVRAVLRERRLLLLVEVRGGQAEGGEEALFV